MSKPRVEKSPFGWTGTVDAANTTVELHDSHGRLRARWAQPQEENRRQVVALPQGQQHTLEALAADGLPAERVVVDNGQPNPGARCSHNGSIELYGRRYEVKHTFSSRSRLLLGERSVGYARSTMFGRPKLLGRHVLDPIDELVLALFWFAVRPGRPGAIQMATMGL